MDDDGALATFPFAVHPVLGRISLIFGVSPARALVAVHTDRVVARFGPWVVETPLGNVASAEVSGPYGALRVVGPARLSLADRGLTSPPRTGPGRACGSTNRCRASTRSASSATRGSR
jgi:hypothetical protein